MMLRTVRMHCLFAVCCLLLPRSTCAQSDLREHGPFTALSRVVQVRADDASLSEVIDELAKQAKITIRIDDEQLAFIGVDAGSERVSCALENASLRATLRVILTNLGLTWRLEGDQLLITTEDDAVSHIETEYFEVVDLVAESQAALPGVYDYDLLNELITSMLAPSTWDEVGGFGAILHLRGKIAVVQTREVLDQIPRLLKGVRDARALASKFAAKSPSPPSVSLMMDPAIEKALARPFTLRIVDTPVHDVVLQLQAAYGVAIYVEDGWEDQLAETVSFAAQGITLQQALDRMLQPLESGWIVQDGAIVISEETGTNEITRAYPVLDLLGEHLPDDDFEGQQRDFDFDELVRFTTMMVAPDSWEAVGGPCSIYSVHDYGFLVVTQTWENHVAIEKLFAHLRSEFADRPRVTLSASKREKDRQRLAVYVFATPESERERQARQFAARKSAVEGRGPETLGRSAAAHPPLRTEHHASSLSANDRRSVARQVNPFGYNNPSGGAAPREFDPLESEAPAAGNAGVPGSGSYRRAEFLPISEQELLDIITSIVEPKTWETREGVFAKAVHRRILIRHSNAVHAKIQELARRLQVKDFRELPELGDAVGTGFNNGGFF